MAHLTEITNMDRVQALINQATVHAGPGWLGDMRREAAKQFQTQGFPTTRNEEWKFTSVRVLEDHGFVLGAKATSEKTPLFTRAFADVAGYHVNFVNGALTSKKSVGEATLPEGVVVCSLKDAFESHENLLKARFNKQVDLSVHPFAAVNTSYFDDGAFILIPKNTRVEMPIYLNFASTPENNHEMNHPRVFVIAESGASVSFVEVYEGDNERTYWCNAVTEIVAEKNAEVHHVKVQLEGQEAVHVANLQVEQARDSVVTSQSITFGGNLTRNDIGSYLGAENCECTLNGLYVGANHQHIDNHTVIDHAFPHCNSYELYRGVLGDSARGVFNGKIFVRQDAQKTDAKQSNNCLLLSKDAVIDTKPQLEIFADDVKCTHGATVGQLDENAIFYLRSRGIAKAQAKALLTIAFANEVIREIPIKDVRDRLEQWLWQAMPVPNA